MPPLPSRRAPCQPAYPRGRRNGNRLPTGFTLIELLVCIAIIGLLAALLIPALGMIQDSVKTTKCASNLRQIGAACFLYAADNNGCVPMAMKPDTSPNWEEAIWPYVYSVVFHWPDNCFQWSPTSSTRDNMFQCPVTSPKKELPLPGLTVCAAHYTYGFNADVGNYSQPISLAKVSQRSKTAMVLESSFALEGYWYYWNAFGLIPHNGGGNVLFFDGHVEYRKLGDMPTNSTDVFWTGIPQ